MNYHKIVKKCDKHWYLGIVKFILGYKFKRPIYLHTFLFCLLWFMFYGSNLYFSFFANINFSKFSYIFFKKIIFFNTASGDKNILLIKLFRELCDGNLQLKLFLIVFFKFYFVAWIQLNTDNLFWKVNLSLQEIISDFLRKLYIENLGIIKVWKVEV